MSTYTVTTKTFKQLAAEFATVFKNIHPDGAPKPATQAERLAPYRPHILKERQRGLSWKQIADGMADPRIDVKVSERVLRMYFGKDDLAGGATAATTGTPASGAASTTPAATKPVSQRVVLDPLTDLPIKLP